MNADSQCRPAIIGRAPPEHSKLRARTAQAALYLGALALLATGADHLEQYYVDQFSTVPTIGTLFFVNFVTCTLVAIGLAAPIRRLAGPSTDTIRTLLAVGGIGIAIGSLAALFISESVGLFGFMEHGYRLTIVEAIVAEVAATLFLGLFIAITWPRRVSRV